MSASRPLPHAVIAVRNDNLVIQSHLIQETHIVKRIYILAIRDYTHENIPPYFAREKRAIRASALNVVSSRKFQTFLPQGEYLP